MSRARIVCSKILNSHKEQLSVIQAEQEIIDKFNDYNNLLINKDQSLVEENGLFRSGEGKMKKVGSERESKKIVDNWLDRNDLSIITDDFLGGATELNKSKIDENLVLENSVDPLLNVPSENLNKDDCDNSIYKGKMWDTLSIASRKSDSDKNSDFIDFNMLPYNFDAGDLMEQEKDSPFANLLLPKGPAETPGPPPSVKSGGGIDLPCDSFNLMETAADEVPLGSMQLLGAPSSKGSSTTGQTKACSANKPPLKIKVPEIANMLGQVAVVSSSAVNKTKARTKVLIRTEKGDEKYEGNTADLVPPLTKKSKQREGAGGGGPALGEHVITSVETAASIREGPHFRREADDSLVRQMLDVLGITDDMLYTVLTSRNLRIWICPGHECRRIYNRLRALKTHILGHYGLKPFRCDYPDCPWSFYTSFKLKRHRETHLKRKNFTCTVPNCNRSFTTIYNLNNHIKLHERPARLKCLVGPCQAHFQTVRAMEKHLKTHNDCLAPYRCEHPGCEKLCYSSTALTAHARCHNHRPEELTCEWQGCGRRFDKPCRLRAHMRQHTGDRPYVCQHDGCKWAFPSSSKLKRHEHKHLGERRFRCTIGDCTKAFMRSEHLRDHTLTHISGSKTFQCPFCDENFSAKASMYVHKKKCHSAQAAGGAKGKARDRRKKEHVDYNDNNNRTDSVTKHEMSESNGKLNSIILSKVNSPAVGETLIERPDSSIIFENNMAPSSPSVMLTSDEYGFDSFKQEFSSLENIEPVLNPVSNVEDANSDSKTRGVQQSARSNSRQLQAANVKHAATSESCARTYLAYHSRAGANGCQAEVSLADAESKSQSPVTVTNMDSTECLLEASPCPSSPRVSDVSLSSMAAPDSEVESALASELRDVGPPLIESAHVGNTITSGSLGCDMSTTSDAAEMLINYDNFQDSHQPIFFSNFILQDADSGGDLFTTEENGEYILLLDSASSAFPESTINLRDLD